jgi:hypothetical protein
MGIANKTFGQKSDLTISYFAKDIKTHNGLLNLQTQTSDALLQL